MAYVGTTAATSVANPPICIARGMGHLASSTGNAGVIGSVGPNGGTGLWYYASVDPSSSIVGTVNYFTDGLQLGMRTGDIIMAAYTSSVQSTTVLLGIGILGTTNSTAGFSMMTGSMMYSTA